MPRPNTLSSLLMATAVALAAQLPDDALAQQRYTVKLLPKPANANTCTWRNGTALNDAGDVLGACGYANYDPLAWLFASWFGYGRPTDADKSVVWRASGVTQVLSSGGGQGFFTSAYHVLGPGLLTTGTIWRGTVRGTWTASGLSSAWRMLDFTLSRQHISRGGNAVLLYKSLSDVGYVLDLTPVALATVVGTTSRELPAPPAECLMHKDGVRKSYAINDAGQVLMMAGWSTFQPATTTSKETIIYKGVPCLWHGSAWQVGPELPLVPEPSEGNTFSGYQPYVSAFSEAGQAIIRAGQGLTYAWAHGQTLKPIDARLMFAGPNGEMLGGADPHDNDPVRAAIISRQGVITDLNTVTPPLPGLRLTTALAGNKKGQILALASPPGTSNPTDRLMVLLTPD